MNARYRHLQIGAQGVGYDLLKRVEAYSYVFTKGPFPDFLHGDQSCLLRHFGGLGDSPHDCAGEPIIRLPGGVLVFDVRVYGACSAKYAAEHAFDPFYSGELLALHGNSKPDPTIWVPANSLVAICALAVYPWAGSFRFASKITPSGSAQAYINGSGWIVVSEGGSSDGHHSLWIQKKYESKLPRIVAERNRC